MRAEQYKSDPAFGSLLAKFSKGDLDSDVVYNTGLEFGLNEGVKGLNRRAASGGSYDSGATLKALTRYANDYGTTKAEGAYNRFMNDKGTTYGFLSGQQGVGLNATDRNQSLNTGLVGQAVGANQNAASQQAQYGVQGAAALNNGIMGGIGNYLYSQRLGSGGGRRCRHSWHQWRCKLSWLHLRQFLYPLVRIRTRYGAIRHDQPSANLRCGR
jgi:hypothetical protein